MILIIIEWDIYNVYNAYLYNVMNANIINILI